MVVEFGVVAVGGWVGLVRVSSAELIATRLPGLKWPFSKPMMVDKRTAELTGEEIVVWGYHGTTQERADAILAHGQFRLSQNPWEWLGDGVYFWQDAPSRALQWGSEWAARTGEKVAVLRARIRLGEGCLDLLDTEAAELIWEYARHFGAKFPKGRPWPMNRSSGRHELDATFFNWVALALAGDGIAVTSIRAAIAEGEPLFEGSPIRRRSHVQIAVRDPKLIDGIEMV